MSSTPSLLSHYHTITPSLSHYHTITPSLSHHHIITLSQLAHCQTITPSHLSHTLTIITVTHSHYHCHNHHLLFSSRQSRRPLSVAQLLDASPKGVSLDQVSNILIPDCINDHTPTAGCYGACLQEQVTCRPVLPLTVPRPAVPLTH